MRNPRQSITPSFVISFKHPFIPLNLELDVIDISNSGFSVREQSEEETLLPGIIISNVFIIFAGIVNMPCSVQVIYRQLEQDNNIVKIGIVITDMDLKAFSYLNHILGAHIDKNARISTEINIEKLWEFFFDAGFIYGAKYEHLHSYRQTFRETYRKLYLDNPNIARHFIYEKNGKIYGHIAMVHAYKPSWIIHHFTALSIGGRLPSFTVLKQIIQFTGSYSRLPSSGMDHVMTYYQPENKVIDKIFGGFTHQIKDAQKSSVDVFSYIFFKKYHPINKLPKDWLLTESKSIDFVKLKEFYKLSSGGLLTSALGLDSSSASITKSFADAGFRRNYKSYCLYYKEEQIAFFIVNQSDLGLNLSDLLNGIKIIVFDKDKLPWHIFLDSVNNLSGFFTEENIPLLIFPSDYLRSQNISEEKQYALWILLSIYGDDYLKYMNKLIRL